MAFDAIHAGALPGPGGDRPPWIGFRQKPPRRLGLALVVEGPQIDPVVTDRARAEPRRGQNRSHPRVLGPGIEDHMIQPVIAGEFESFAQEPLADTEMPPFRDHGETGAPPRPSVLV